MSLQVCFSSIKNKSKNIEANNNMGVILSAQKNYEKSTEAFKRSIELNSLFAESYYGMG